jgi:ElaB/YqjD/DUF883 family membrane-anchored ribosome-binding protein
MNDGNGESEVVQQLHEGREWIAERFAQADKQARSFLREHPILTLACAVGVGYLAARLWRARK